MQNFFKPGQTSAEHIGGLIDDITTQRLGACVVGYDLRAQAMDIRGRADNSHDFGAAMTFLCAGPLAIVSPQVWMAGYNRLKIMRAARLEGRAANIEPIDRP